MYIFNSRSIIRGIVKPPINDSQHPQLHRLPVNDSQYSFREFIKSDHWCSFSKSLFRILSFSFSSLNDRIELQI